MTGVGPKDLLVFLASRGAAVSGVAWGASWKVRSEVERARASVEGAARPLKGDASNMPFVDDGDRGTGKDFPEAGESGDKSGMVLDR